MFLYSACNCLNSCLFSSIACVTPPTVAISPLKYISASRAAWLSCCVPSDCSNAALLACLWEISSSVDHQPSSSPHGARGSPGLPWSYAAHRARGELGKRRDPEPSRIGAEVRSPSTVSFCRMQLLEARFVPFRRKALDGSHP